MKIQYVLLTALGMLLLGCNNNDYIAVDDGKNTTTGVNNEDVATLKDTDYSIKMDTTKIGKAAKEGAKCGGNTGYTCAPDLFCKRDYTHKDKEGVCIGMVADKNMECEKSDKMVCGEWNGYKMGYSSACEAKRHGATNVVDGFCKKDITLQNDCTRGVVPFGKCEDIASGVQYNASQNKCEQVEYYACMVDSPFQTMIECEEKCVK